MDKPENTLPGDRAIDTRSPTDALWQESTGVFDDARQHLADDTLVGALPPYDLESSYTGHREAIESLWRHVEHTRDSGRLSFVVLVGEPGLGKSRALAELRARMATDAPRFRMFVAGGGGRVAYSAFSRLFSRRFEVAPGMSSSEVHACITDGVSEVLSSGRVTEVVHLLAHLMRAPILNSPVVDPLASAPQRLETRMFLAVRRFLAADADAQPLVLAIEDLDQCSPKTINLLHYLAAGLAAAPVVILGTARKRVFERYPSFGDSDTPLHRVELAPLTPDQAGEMFRDLCRPLAAIPDALEAHARALGGSPRAILELMHLLIETDVVVRADNHEWVIDDVALATHKLPDTYEQLVERRLDVMNRAERALLSMAAVIGETFWLDAVVALMRAHEVSAERPDGPTLADIAKAGDRSRTAVMATLNQLSECEWILIVEEPSVAGEHEYRFAYPHLRAMVLDRIDPDERRGYHRTAAQWLELRPEGRRPLAQEDIGDHLQRAGHMVAAAQRYRRAADSARDGYFNDRAIVLYMRALQCIGERDTSARIHLWHDVGTVYDLKGDFEAALGAFERMLRLAWVVAARTKAAVAFNKMGRVWRRKGSLERSLEYLQRGADLFQQTSDDRGIAGSLDDIARVLSLLGRYDEAYVKAKQGFELRGQDGDPRSVASSLSNLGNIQRARGNFAEARECHSEALERRWAVGDRSGVISSLNNIAVIDYEQGNYVQARSGWVKALSEAGSIGALPLCALALSNLGELALAENDHDEARRRLDEALSIATDVDDRRLQAEITRNLALVESATGRTVQARALAQQSLEIASAAGLRDGEARALTCLGQVLSSSLFDSSQESGEEDSAERYFERGMTILRELGNESEIARGLEVFGRFKLERDQREQGVAMLEQAISLFGKLGMKRRDIVQKLLDTV